MSLAYLKEDWILQDGKVGVKELIAEHSKSCGILHERNQIIIIVLYTYNF